MQAAVESAELSGASVVWRRSQHVHMKGRCYLYGAALMNDRACRSGSESSHHNAVLQPWDCNTEQDCRGWVWSLERT